MATSVRGALGMGDLAWVTHCEQTYAAASVAEGPRSAVVDLIEGVREQVDDADYVLRNRIYTTAARSELDDGIVKLAGRRWTHGVVETGGGHALRCTDVGPAARAAQRRMHDRVVRPPLTADPMSVAADMADRATAANHTVPRHRADRPVGAALHVEGQGTLMAARNHNGRNRVHHAEFCLASAWWAEHRCPLPAGTTIFVTLQPCRMCAAALVAIAPVGGIVVRFRDVDPGRLARCTALDARGWVEPVPGWIA